MKKLFLSALALSFSVSLFAGDFNADPTEGYRGFAGLNVFSGIGKYPYDRFAITTAHGFQTDNLFVGLGASMQFVTNNSNNTYEICYDEEGCVYSYTEYDSDYDFAMPFFVNASYEAPMGKFAPFADLKLGYAVGDVNGLYVLPSVGVRLSHFNVWCGYNLLQDKSVCNNEKKITNYQSIAFGVSIDWGARKNTN